MKFTKAPFNKLNLFPALFSSVQILSRPPKAALPRVWIIVLILDKVMKRPVLNLALKSPAIQQLSGEKSR